MPEATAYDRVAYPGYPFINTHPDHLAVLAGLHGMAPAPPERCRVLEIGCGDGGNLIPMAAQLPQSEFLGIDLSERAIERGCAAIAELGLHNIALLNRNITDMSAHDGRFDYIIAHGVYSWVPQAVRDKILSVFAQNLAPQGIAYVSYNAFPGAHLRNLARSIMQFHVRGNADPGARIAQARMLIKFLAEVSPEDEVYGLTLRDQFNRIANTPDQVLVHDDLDESNTAFFLYEVVEAAARLGLHYVADADVPDTNEAPSERVRAMLANIPERDFVVREQYHDFITGRAFRQSLFCHHDIALRRPLASAGVKDCYVSSRAVPTGEFEPSQPGIGEFRIDGHGTLKTDHRLSKAALRLLGEAWPQAVAFADLVEQASSPLSRSSEARPQLDGEVDALADILFRAFCAGQVRLHRGPLPLTTSIGERPMASLCARWQARRQTLVTNLQHILVLLDDETARRLLILADGSRTVDELARDLKAGMVDGANGMENPSVRSTDDAPREITPDTVQSDLMRFARLGLLAQPGKPPR